MSAYFLGSLPADEVWLLQLPGFRCVPEQAEEQFLHGMGKRMVNPNGNQFEADAHNTHWSVVLNPQLHPNSLVSVAEQHSTVPSSNSVRRYGGICLACSVDSAVGQNASLESRSEGSLLERTETAPESWQFFAISQSLHNPASGSQRHLHDVVIRIDAPSGQPSSHLFWTETVAESPTNASGQKHAPRAAEESPVSQLAPRVSEIAENAPSEDSHLTYAKAKSAILQAAHDVRFPIAAARKLIQQFDNILTAPLNESMVRTQLQQVDDQLRLADNWTSSLLVEHDTEQQGKMIRKRFYPEQWRLEIVSLLESIARDHEVTLQWVGWDRSLPRLYADHRRLSRAMLNLVADAIEASPRGTTVQIAVEWQNNVTPRISFSVVGHRRIASVPTIVAMNQSERGEFSDLLHPAELSTGIRIAKNLIESCGGVLTSHLNGNQGASFRFSLPVDTCQATLRTWLSMQRIKAEDATNWNVRVYALGTQGIDSVVFDERLQRHARSCDLVYRIGERRWLWFALTNHAQAKIDARIAAACDLKEFRSATATRIFRDEVLNVPFFSDNGSANHQSLSARIFLVARRLADGVQPLLSKQVPPINALRQTSALDVCHDASAEHQLLAAPAIDRPKGFEIGHAQSALIRKPHFGRAICSSSSSSERGPRTADQTFAESSVDVGSIPYSADEGDASHVTALQEIAGQWRGMRDQLDNLNKRLRQISLHPMV